jgi:hypothetical protein
MLMSCHSQEHAARVLNKMPEYLRAKGFHTPTDGASGPFQYALETKLSYFDYIHESPVKMERFNRCMTGNRVARRHWVEWFPIREHLLKDFENCKSPNSSFLVDMGGGRGHDLERLVKDFPETSGYLILQDLPGTIRRIANSASGFTPMVHDIFEPQPITGMAPLFAVGIG